MYPRISGAGTRSDRSENSFLGCEGLKFLFFYFQEEISIFCKSKKPAQKLLTYENKEQDHHGALDAQKLLREINQLSALNN